MKVEDNVLLEGLSGKVGGWIYYQRFGKTFARKAPGSYNKVPTEKQAIVRARFTEAHHFAQSVINDPVKKAEYEKKSRGRSTAYSKAVSEYLLSGG